MMSVNEELIDRVLEGEASDSEAAEIQEWLKMPANLEQFVRRAEMHSDLRRSLRRKSIQANALDRRSDEVIEAKPRTSTLRTRQVLALTAAGLVTAACFLLIIIQNNGGGRREDTARAASIVMDIDALLTKDGQEWKGSALPVGNYQLRKGLLNLRFGNGVLVYVEAPAQFDAINDERVVLYSGRLSANVPPEGIGFTVETPEAEVVDFGTEFSVDVESGASEVHVFDGLVRVHPEATKGGDLAESVDLQASQAVRITGQTATPVDIEIARDRFIRNFDEPKRKYARSVKELSPVAFYRMPIRDRGMVSEPPHHSGVVLTGEGVRPPHARGVFTGGSLRVRADSTGRGGRVDSPPELSTGRFSLAVFVYLETQSQIGTVATNLNGSEGSFSLSLDESGVLKATINDSDGKVCTVAGQATLPVTTWRHIVMTADGDQLQLYEDGKEVASTQCGTVATTHSDTVWFGTDADAVRLWDGRIDELALFDKALAENEIAELYRAAKDEMARSK